MPFHPPEETKNQRVSKSILMRHKQNCMNPEENTVIDLCKDSFGHDDVSLMSSNTASLAESDLELEVAIFAKEVQTSVAS